MFDEVVVVVVVVIVVVVVAVAVAVVVVNNYRRECMQVVTKRLSLVMCSCGFRVFQVVHEVLASAIVAAAIVAVAAVVVAVVGTTAATVLASPTAAAAGGISLGGVSENRFGSELLRLPRYQFYSSKGKLLLLLL